MRLTERHELNVPATLAMSAALTASSLYFANTERDPSQVLHTAEDVVMNRPDSSFELDVQAAIPPVVGKFAVHSTVEASTRGVKHQYIDVERTVPVLRPWAKKFSDDPMATKSVGPSELAPVLSAAAELTKDKTIRIDGLTVQGMASDEDDTALLKSGANPGLGINNQKNVELADTRAKTAGPTAEQGVEAITGYDVFLNYEPGKEVVDPALAKRIFAEAEKLGVTPNELVMTFNRQPDTLPASVQKTLGKLVDDRRVDFTLHTVKTIPSVPKLTDAEIVPVVAPIVRTRSAQVVPAEAAVTAPRLREPRANFAPVTMKAAQYSPPVARRQVQPRNYNFSQNPARKGGRMDRSHGGNRSGKRS